MVEFFQKKEKKVQLEGMKDTEKGSIALKSDLETNKKSCLLFYTEISQLQKITNTQLQIKVEENFTFEYIHK